MQEYTRIAYERRGIDPVRDKYQPCEYCEWRYIYYKDFPGNAPRLRREIPNACDVDHIEWRGGWEDRNFENRMYNPENLILLCRRCHEQKKWDEEKKLFKKIVLSKKSTHALTKNQTSISEPMPTGEEIQNSIIQEISWYDASDIS